MWILDRRVIMTEKRFTIDEKMLGYMGEFVYDNGVLIRNLSDVVECLNNLHEENKQYKILTDELKRQNKKLKGRLNDLGVEYYD